MEKLNKRYFIGIELHRSGFLESYKYSTNGRFVPEDSDIDIEYYKSVEDAKNHFLNIQQLKDAIKNDIKNIDDADEYCKIDYKVYCEITNYEKYSDIIKEVFQFTLDDAYEYDYECFISAKTVYTEYYYVQDLLNLDLDNSVYQVIYRRYQDHHNAWNIDKYGNTPEDFNEDCLLNRETAEKIFEEFVRANNGNYLIEYIYLTFNYVDNYDDKRVIKVFEFK